MPIQVEFIAHHQAVLQTYCDPLDCVQLNALRTKMEQEIFPTSTEKLHIIADFRRVTNLPETILSSGSYMLRSAHVNTGTIICVTTNGFIQSIARIFSVITYKHPFMIVSCLEQAYAELDLLLAKEKQRDFPRPGSD